jgi:PAS domain S-box-containing protein
LLVVLVGGFGYYRIQERQERAEVWENLGAVADLKIRQLADWRQSKLNEGLLLAEDLYLNQGISQWLADPSRPLPEGVQARLRSIVARRSFADISIMNGQGKGLWTLNKLVGTAHPEALETLTKSLADGKVRLTPLHRSEDLAPHLSLVVPVEASDNQSRQACLVLLFLAEDYLYPLIQSWPSPSASAETLLVQKEGNEVVFLNDLRHQKDTALKLRYPLDSPDLPAAMAVRGQTGVVEGVDYRGVPVLSVLGKVPGTRWFLVSKMDKAEAYAGWRVRSTLISGFIVAMLLGLVGLLVMFWLRSDKNHFLERFRLEAARRLEQERYKVMLMSVGDGVICTDSEGNLEVMNAVAENLTGWKADEAKGKPLETVFPIFNETTRAVVENPVRRVMREGLIVGLANHTVLVSKNGSERPIADSGAPIRREDGQITGAVLVFRDQTADRDAAQALQRERDNLGAIMAASPVGILVFTSKAKVRLANPSVERLFGKEFNANWEISCGEFISCVNRAEHPQGCGHSSNCADCALLRSIKTVIAEGRGQGHQDAQICRTCGLSHGVRWIRFSMEPVFINGTLHVLAALEDITGHKAAEAERELLHAQLLQAQKMEAVGRLAGGVAHDFNNILGVILGNAEMALDALPPGSVLRQELDEIVKAAKRSEELTRRLLAFARKQTASPKVLDLNHTVGGMLRMLSRLIGEDIDISLDRAEGLWPVRMDPSQLDQVLANLVVNARDAIEGVGKVTIETANTVFDEAYCAEHRGFVPGDFVMLAVSDSGRGMTADIKQHLFEPFFTTKEVGKGTGLGLATVYGIIKQNDGFINVYSEPGEGTTFRLYFPRVVGEAAEVIARKASPELVGGQETILLVEDEKAILELGKRLLEKLGYKVLMADGPLAALSLAANRAQHIDLLITDVVMPDMNGKVLAEKLALLRPNLPCLYMSGYTANAIAHRGVLDHGLHFIQKPFSSSELAQKVREALG